MLFVRFALPAYVVLPTAPLTSPFQAMWRVAAAETLDNVEQLNGLAANDPVTTPVVILTALELATHRDSFPATTEEPVPPPETLRWGEKLTLADNAACHGSRCRSGEPRRPRYGRRCEPDNDQKGHCSSNS